MAVAINQTNAMQGNITPGDTPGFPITISKPGSYLLTSNLRVPDNVEHAIEIVTADVTLDLGGFSIIKQHEDNYSAVFGQNVEHVTVLNGHIKGMGGIELNGPNNCVEKVHLHCPFGSGATGIHIGDFGVVSGNILSGVDVGIIVGKGSTVSNNIVRQAGVGITAADASIVKRNTLDAGGKLSIMLGARCILSENVIVGGTDAGIQAGEGCLIKDNTLGHTQAWGIGAGDGSVVSGNSVDKTSQGPGIGVGNGCTVTGNSVRNCGEGIGAGEGNTIIGNSVVNCIGLGLKLGQSSGYGNNALADNNGGNANPQVSGGIRIDENVCGISLCS